MKIGKVNQWIDAGSTPVNVMGKFKLKPMQRAILNCLEKNNVLANLPTGFGKSLLFQYFAASITDKNKCVILVVPLRALLWDVIREAENLSIDAQQLQISTINQFSKSSRLPQLLVMTPQKIFHNQAYQDFLFLLHSKKQIKLFVIDECHCVLQWGHDFRPDYLKLQKFTTEFIGTRFLLMSATVSPDYRNMITSNLGIRIYFYFQASYNRPNLFYSVIKQSKQEKHKHIILDFLTKKQLLKSSGIIYCRTIRLAQQLFSSLKSQLQSVGLFHSKVSEGVRLDMFQKFMKDQIKVMIATTCFGMGINKSDIRFVINLGVPSCSENYYQESGRAGRDGLLAHCLLISISGEDNSTAYFLNQIGNPNVREYQTRKYHQLKNYVSSFECRKKKLFQNLGEQFDQCQKTCDNCQPSAPYEEKDFTQKCFKFISSLTRKIIPLTKKQLSSYLKGEKVDTKMKWEVNLGPETKGLFKQESKQKIQQIIDAMISQQWIERVIKTRDRYSWTNYMVKKINYKSQKIVIRDVNRQPIKLKNKFQEFLKNRGLEEKQISKTSSFFEIDGMKQAKIKNQGLKSYGIYGIQDKSIRNQSDDNQEQFQPCIENEIIQIEDDEQKPDIKNLSEATYKEQFTKSVQLSELSNEILKKKPSIKRSSMKKYDFL